MNPLRNAQWTADYLGITVQSLYNLRMTGRGPRAVRVGKYLKFRESEIFAWVESQLEPRRA
ncbi:helix-turn-helix domain-containing protein [Arthrobacter sp. SDTb3-6]|nr:helix-turn-helix domain-containing protein [Arthrobacter sp. SDTb3-6]